MEGKRSMPPIDEGALDQLRELLGPFRHETRQDYAERLMSRLLALSQPYWFANQPDGHPPVTSLRSRTTRAATGRLTDLGDARDRFLSAVTEMSGTADDWCHPDPQRRTRAFDALRIHIVTRGTFRMDKEAQRDRLHG